MSNGYFTPNEEKMMAQAAQAVGIKNVASFISFCVDKQKQFGNVTGGYNPVQTIEATARKFLKSQNN